VRHGLAGTLARARELFAVEIDQAHVLGRHEALQMSVGVQSTKIVADAHRDVAAIAVGVILRPQAVPHVADALF